MLLQCMLFCEQDIFHMFTTFHVHVFVIFHGVVSLSSTCKFKNQLMSSASLYKTLNWNQVEKRRDKKLYSISTPSREDDI